MPILPKEGRQRIVYFDGSADVAVGKGLYKDKTISMIFTDYPKNKNGIGEDISEEESKFLKDPKVALAFEKAESVDVIIEVLKEIKEKMEG